MTVERRAADAAELEDAEGLGSLLEFLKRNRGFDFTGYKRPSLARRIRKRMAEAGVSTFEEYQDRLEVTPDEFTHLFNTILINVTSFFRDPAAWEYVSAEVLPAILQAVPEPEPVRVWSAACATGEEAYTVAMVFAELIGDEAFKRRVKIYATDVDEDALARARQAAYAPDAFDGVPEGLASKYFDRTPTGLTFRSDLRRSVIFGRNDLVQDAPISRIDLLVSRNALMYFTPETQSRILRHFSFALKDSGFLFLGKSEMLITHADLFTPVDLRRRVFQKARTPPAREPLTFVTDGGPEHEAPAQSYEALRGAALEAAPMAMIVVDRAGLVAASNRRARGLFRISPADVGRPFHNLELSYRPVDLRSAIETVLVEGDEVALGRVPWSTGDGEAVTLDISARPVGGEHDQAAGVAVAFDDVTRLAHLDEEHERSKRRLETAYEELQSTVEELETTNEELHSTNEELETTNEELQSSNEELETMNEELHSTNDELEVVNDEQAIRGKEVDKANLFLEGILTSLGVGVVVLDRDLRVQVWNSSATDMWGLSSSEVEGRHFLELDIGLPAAALREPIRGTLGDGGEGSDTELDAVSRRGTRVVCSVKTRPLRSAAGETYGAILIMSASKPPDA